MSDDPFEQLARAILEHGGHVGVYGSILPMQDASGQFFYTLYLDQEDGTGDSEANVAVDVVSARASADLERCAWEQFARELSDPLVAIRYLK